MPLSFSDSPQNLFNRWGRLGKIIAQNKSSQTTQLVNFNEVIDQLDSEPDVQALVGSAYLGLVNQLGNGMGGSLQSYASAILNRMVFRDNPLLNQTLTQNNTLASLLNLVRQMKDQAATVLAMTVSTTVPSVASRGSSFGTNMLGNGVVVLSTKRPGDGRSLENAFSETLTVVCTRDSYGGGATAGNETMTFQGEGSQNDFFAADWPLGSNCNTSVSCIDGNENVSSGNLLTNSGFDGWTGGALDDWTTVQGGSALAQDTAQAYDSGSCLNFTGDGATNPILTQEFGEDTTGELEAVNQYSVCLWLKRSGTAIASGPTLLVELIDGNDAVVNDQQSVANRLTIDLSSLTTLYQPFTVSFRTPYIMPATVKLRLKFTGALPSGRTVYIDKLGLGEMIQLYRQGPYGSVHAGSVPFQVNDYCQCEVSNSRGAAGTLNTWQTLFARLFPIAWQNEILLPSSSSPSVSDGLIG